VQENRLKQMDIDEQEAGVQNLGGQYKLMRVPYGNPGAIYGEICLQGKLSSKRDVQT